MVVPVNLVMEDAALLDDDGKQSPVRRSDLTLGENPGSSSWDTASPLSSARYTVQKQSQTSGKETI